VAWAAAAPLAVAAIGLAAAGCGSSNTRTPASGHSNSAGGYGSAASAGNTPTPAATTAITVAQSPLGAILTDGRGRTVYLFEKDAATTSKCNGPCASAWPPVTTTGQPSVAGGADQAKLGTTTRQDGTMQVTYAGHPLYRFAGDAKSGDTNGQGLTNFGAGWYVLTAGGQKVDNNG
jgi:predicted lipoprotein with Yx(FWY)xxD motif